MKTFWLNLICVAAVLSAPSPLLAQSAKIITLRAADAKLTGPSVKINPTTKVAAWWKSAEDRATWRFKVEKTADMEVSVVYSVPNNLAQQPFVVEVDGKSVFDGKLPGTSGWTNFQRRAVGKLKLAAGEHRLSFRPAGAVRGEDLLDLRMVIVAPPGAKLDKPALNPMPSAAQPKPTSVTDMLQRIRVPEGFVVERVAGPPMVNRPISADFDEHGRLYVTDSSGSRENVQVQLKKKPHRIVRLEDTDGDGVFDKSTVFADKMMFPEGAMWFDGSLYVTAPPHIWKLTDTNDDGVADKREIWFDAKTLGGCANDLHGPFLGPDGWFYWCKGEFAQQTYERPGKPPLVTKAAHIFRRHPKGGFVEVVMTGGMNNPVDVAFTPGGERIFSTTFLQNPAGGKRDGLIHAVYGGVYPKKNGVLAGHPRTGELMPVLTHMGVAAPCGLIRLETDQLGDGFRDNLLACQFNTHKVSRHVLAKRGATFITQDEDFLTCDHKDFHPTDVLEDADGSVLVIDTGGWYMLCCPTSRLHKPDVLGAIYRVRRKDAPKIADPRGQKIDWSALNADRLTRLLGDPRPAVRRRALELLVTKAAVPLLVKTLKGDSTREARLQAVWALARIDQPGARAAVRSALADKDEQVRQAAIHSTSVWRDSEAVAPLVALLKGESLHNRRAAAEAIGRIGDKAAIDDLLAAAADYRGRELDHSLVYALIELGDAQQVRKGLAAKDPHTRRAAMLALENLPDAKLRPESIVSLLDSDDSLTADTAWWLTQRHPEWNDEMASYLRTKILDPKLAPEALGPLTRHLSRFAESAKVQEIMSAGLRDTRVPRSTKLAILDAVAAANLKKMPSSWSVEMARMLAMDDDELVARAVSGIHALSDSSPTASVVAGLRKVAENENAPIEDRLRALAASPLGGKLSDRMMRLVTSQLSAAQPVRNRSLATDVLLGASLSDDQLVLLAASLKKTASMDLVRLLQAFEKSTRAAVGSQLVASLAECPAATALDAAAVRKAIGRYGPKIRERAEPLLAKIEAASEEKIARLEAVLELVDDGDVRRGREVFYGTKAACSSCHAVGYNGGNVGPDLTHIGRIRDDRALLESILLPSASFVQSYAPETVVTTSGKVYNGIVKEESPRQIVLAIDAERTVRIPRDEIDERTAGTVSIMPTGLERQLTPQQLADLVVFLKNAK